MRDELTKKRFIKFILDKEGNITISDRDVILELLCQLEYKNEDLISLLSKDKYFEEILEEVKYAEMYCDYPSNSGISFDCLFAMYKQDSIL